MLQTKYTVVNLNDYSKLAFYTANQIHEYLMQYYQYPDLKKVTLEGGSLDLVETMLVCKVIRIKGLVKVHDDHIIINHMISH